jgi:hypothetical protein
MRRSSITAFAALALAAMATLALACGFEDPNGASAQRVMLNLVYPKSLYALGAVDTALRAGVIRREHLTMSSDPSAFHRTAGNLRRFARRLSDGAHSVMPAFSLVLLGPVLWTRFVPRSDGLVADIHAAEPLAGRVVMVTDVPVIAALVSGDISGADADASELVRFYGDPAEIKVLRKALALAFRADADQKGRAQDRGALPTFR